MTSDKRRDMCGRPDDVGAYRVDVWAATAALITRDPRIGGEEEMRVLAWFVREQLRANGAPPEHLGGDVDEYIAMLDELYARGWMGVEDGRAYLSRPVLGPLGDVVDRVRLDATGREALALIWGAGL